MKAQTKGILCIIFSAFCFAVMNVCVRAAGDLPSIEKSFFRNLVAAVVALAALLKKTSPDTALLLALAVCVVVLTALARGLEEVITFLRELLDWGGLSVELFVPLLKTVAIALISRVGGALCRDAGEGAMASLVEIAGAFAAILVSLPLFRAAWRMLEGLM